MRKISIFFTLMVVLLAFNSVKAQYPAYYDFENDQELLPTGWIVEEGGGATGMNSWHVVYNETGNNGHNGSQGFVSISLNTTNPKDSWLITEPFTMEAGKVYKINFFYSTLAQGAYEYMEVKFGTEQNIAGMTTQIWDNQFINTPGWQEGTCYIKPETTQDFYVSWHAYSEPAEFNLVLDDITIEELDATPAAYTQPYCKTLPITEVNQTSTFTLNISNQGFDNLELISANYPDFIQGPTEFSIADNEDLEFQFTPTEQGVYYDTIRLETNGGLLKVPVFSNSAKTVFPVTSLLDIYDNFTVYDENGDTYSWQINTYRPFEGQYSFQVMDSYTAEGYDDWIISEPVYVLENDVLTFIARSFDGFSGPGIFSIKLSTTAGNQIDDFDVTIEPDFYLPGNWTGYSFDLTDYAGQIVTLAIHSNNPSLLAMSHYVDNFGMPATENPMICTEITFPQNESSEINPNNTTLQWEQLEIANDYILYFGTDNPPTNILDGEIVGDATSYNLGVLDDQTTYYWQIVPFYGDIVAESCEVNTFTTGVFSNTNELQNSFQIFAEGRNININATQNYDLQIVGIDGKIVYEQKNISQTSFQKPINQTGIFVVKVKTENKVITKKVIVM